MVFPRYAIQLSSDFATLINHSSSHPSLAQPLAHWDIQYYMGIFRTLCSEIRMSKLHWPAREYIVQVARFDPAKG
jgi:hypothetical protein